MFSVQCAHRVATEETQPGMNESVSAQPVDEPGLPRLELPETEIDLGELRVGELIYRDIEILNTGTADLILTKTVSDCFCTEVLRSDEIIKPGDVGIIEISFAAKYIVGPTNKILRVFSNDPEQPSIDITLKANIKKWFTFLSMSDAQGFYVYIESYQGIPQSKSLVFRCLDGESCDVELVVKTLPFLTVEILPVSTQGCLFVDDDEIVETKPTDQILKLTVSKNAPVKKYSGIIRLGFDKEGQKKVDLRVNGIIKRNVELSNNVFSFGQVPQHLTNPVVKSLDVFHVQNNKFRIVDASTDLDGITVEFDRDKKPFHQVKVKYNGGLEPGKYAGRLFINVEEREEYVVQGIFNINVIP
jgi:hypothetical protein